MALLVAPLDLGAAYVPSGTLNADKTVEPLVADWTFGAGPGILGPTLKSVTPVYATVTSLTIAATVSVAAGDLIVCSYTDGSDFANQVSTASDGTNTYTRQTSLPLPSINAFAWLADPA